MGLCDQVTVMHQGRDLVTGDPARCATTPGCSTPTSAAATTSCESVGG